MYSLDLAKSGGEMRYFGCCCLTEDGAKNASTTAVDPRLIEFATEPDKCKPCLSLERPRSAGGVLRTLQKMDCIYYGERLTCYGNLETG